MAVTLFMAIFLGGGVRSSNAQGFLNELGRQLGNQVEREIRGRINPPSNGGSRTNPGTGPQPGAQGMSIPGESGRQNNGGGAFDGGDFFGPPSGGTGPRIIPPRLIQPRQGRRTVDPQPIYRPPGNAQPMTPQTTPQRTYPQTTIPRQGYSESDPAGVMSIPPPRAAVLPAVSNQEFRIRCPKDLSSSVSYQLVSGQSEYPFTMTPGQIHKIVESRVWVIRYSSDGREVSYRLRGGKTYEFARLNGKLTLYEDDTVEAEPPKRSSLRNG